MFTGFLVMSFGDSVAQLLSRKIPTPLEMVGVNDTFGESGTPMQLLEKYMVSNFFYYFFRSPNSMGCR